MIPADAAAWRGVTAGAFIAFFAFIGFETLANLAEEVKTPTARFRAVSWLPLRQVS